MQHYTQYIHVRSNNNKRTTEDALLVILGCVFTFSHIGHTVVRKKVHPLIGSTYTSSNPFTLMYRPLWPSILSVMIKCHNLVNDRNVIIERVLNATHPSLRYHVLWRNCFFLHCNYYSAWHYSIISHWSTFSWACVYWKLLQWTILYNIVSSYLVKKNNCTNWMVTWCECLWSRQKITIRVCIMSSVNHY